MVADGPAAVAAAVLRLMDDPGERARVARAGRERVLSHHAWEASMRRLDGIIARCVASAPRAPARLRGAAPRAMVGDGAPR